MRIFISAGEASGDALGASLLVELKKRAPDLDAFGMGGPLMASLGFRALKSSNEIGVVGFAEVVLHLPRLLRLNRELAEAAIKERPDVAVLIDVPDFNVRLAKRLRKAGIKVAFYVGPSVWAWRKWRVRKFRSAIDRMLVLFPFEVEVWKAAGVDVVCVGHPLLDEIPRAPENAAIDEKTVALLPGSRPVELARHMATMIQAASMLQKRGAAERFVLPIAPGLDPRIVRAVIDTFPDTPTIELVIQSEGDPMPRRRAIARSAIALVASGTATLETALLGRPQVIVYRVSGLTYLIAKLLAKVKHLGLVNLIAGREIAKELLQDALTPASLADAAEALLKDLEARRVMISGYDEVRSKLGDPGASSRAADAVLSLIR